MSRNIMARDDVVPIFRARLPSRRAWRWRERSCCRAPQRTAYSGDTYRKNRQRLTARMQGCALALSLGLAALCVASAADLSNGFNSDLGWLSPAKLQASGG